MLVLSRDSGESIMVWTKDGKIKVRVKISQVDSKGQVKLAIDAPKDVMVDREEVFYRRLRG